MTTTVFVHSLTGGRGKWSKYALPFSVEAFAQLGDDLYIRTGDRILRVVAGRLTDHVNGSETGFGGVVQWPWIDLGTMGLSKKLVGFDIVSAGNPRISFGYDQTTPATFTTAVAISPDTYSGGMIPLAVRAPSVSMKVEFLPGTAWELQGATVYLSESKGNP